MTGLGEPKLRTKFEGATSAVAEILKGTPKFLGAFLAKGYAHFLLWV